MPTTAIRVNADSILNIAILALAITILVYGIFVIGKSKVALGALSIFASLIIFAIGISRIPLISRISSSVAVPVAVPGVSPTASAAVSANLGRGELLTSRISHGQRRDAA